MWKTNPTPKHLLDKEYQTNCSTTLRYFPMLTTSLAKVGPKHIKEWLASLLVDSLVSHSPSPASKKSSKEKRTTETSGLKPTVPFAWFDPDSGLVRTSQACLFLDICPPFSQTWPKSGCYAHGLFWVQTIWEPDIVGEDCGYWLTPSTVTIEGGKDRIEKRTEYRASIGRQYVPGSLAEQVYWPTPRSDYEGGVTEAYNDGKGWYRENKDGVRWGVKLRDAVVSAEKWPTPKANLVHPFIHDGNRDKIANRNKSNLEEVVAKYPTPRCSEYKDVGPVGSKSHDHMTEKKYLCAKTKDPDLPTGQLNPTWTSWLMGWPLGFVKNSDGEWEISDWSDVRPLHDIFFIDWSIDPADIDSDVTSWATPAVSDTRSDIRKPEERSDRANKGGCANLREQVLNWPSPRASNPGSRPNKKGGKILAEEAKKASIPTPRATDWKDGGWNSKTKDKKDTMSCPGFAKTHSGRGLIPRVGVEIFKRIPRLKCIGNGWVPHCGAKALMVLMEVNRRLENGRQSQKTGG